MQIAAHTFLITGGGSGLGAATARLLAEAGARVVIADVNDKAGADLARALGENVRFVAASVTDEAAVNKSLETAVAVFGALHGLVNCAGIVIGERVLSKQGPHRLASFANVVEVNLVGSFNAIRLAAQAMQNNAPTASGERGVIVNTASIAAFDGQVGQAAYAASKAGVVGMTLPIARELARFGIRVMTIAPGIFDTPMMAGLPEDVRASLGAQVPFPPRLGRPEEFAQLVKHIVENEMLNGEVIRLDGAIRMGAG